MKFEKFNVPKKFSVYQSLELLHSFLKNYYENLQDSVMSIKKSTSNRKWKQVLKKAEDLEKYFQDSINVIQKKHKINAILFQSEKFNDDVHEVTKILLEDNKNIRELKTDIIDQMEKLKMNKKLGFFGSDPMETMFAAQKLQQENKKKLAIEDQPYQTNERKISNDDFERIVEIEVQKRLDNIFENRVEMEVQRRVDAAVKFHINQMRLSRTNTDSSGSSSRDMKIPNIDFRREKLKTSTSDYDSQLNEIAIRRREEQRQEVLLQKKKVAELQKNELLYARSEDFNDIDDAYSESMSSSSGSSSSDQLYQLSATSMYTASNNGTPNTRRTEPPPPYRKSESVTIEHRPIMNNNIVMNSSGTSLPPSLPSRRSSSHPFRRETRG